MAVRIDQQKRFPMMSRRAMLTGVAALPTAAYAARAATMTGGPVAADWNSLAAHYRLPEWFRDAKLGLWSHWGAQCVPEQGDWYGRRMYIQGDSSYDHHFRTYGHPSEVGFMQMYPRWGADLFDPDALAARYRKAGARYIVSMASHHDNFDHWNSRHHEWNAVRVGPKRDLVGAWAKATRAQGLRFGVSNHSSHAWHWWQTAYGYDAEGTMAGKRYDAYRLRKADGRGTWWEGLDPQRLYTGPTIVAPDGIRTIAAMNAWQEKYSAFWNEDVPRQNPAFADRWLLRQNDLVDQHKPDFVYFDDTRLPLEQRGLDAVAHYYNQAIALHGETDVVVTAKLLFPWQRTILTEDVERGYSATLREHPWQTDTCIGDWHYNRKRFEDKSYVPAKNVVQRLCDVVSKNGNLLLSIPQRGDGSIDSEEEKILDSLTEWMAINGDAIHGTRPWRIFGEGPTQVSVGAMNEGGAKPFTADDVRFTVDRKAGVLNAFALEWPGATLSIRALGRKAMPGAEIDRVHLIGGGDVKFGRTSEALILRMPDQRPGPFVPGFCIAGRGLI